MSRIEDEKVARGEGFEQLEIDILHLAVDDLKVWVSNQVELAESRNVRVDRRDAGIRPADGVQGGGRAEATARFHDSAGAMQVDHGLEYRRIRRPKPRVRRVEAPAGSWHPREIEAPSVGTKGLELHPHRVVVDRDTAKAIVGTSAPSDVRGP